MPENMSIAYRGANYAIGQGPQFYGIWHATAPQGAPLEWWPLTPEGWTGAWSRFASIEVPGTIAPASAIQTPGAIQGPGAIQSPGAGQAPTAIQAPTETGVPAGMAPTSPATGTPAAEAPTSQISSATGTPAPSAAAGAPAAVAGGLSGPSGEAIDPLYGQVTERPANPARMVRRSRIAAALLAVGVLLGLIGLFPDYFTGASLASQPPQLVPHVIYLAAWACGAVLVLFSGVRRQAGALIAAGVTVVTFGLFFADLGTPIADGANLIGAGLILALVGWVACAAGAVLACAASGLTWRGWRAGSQRARRVASHEIVPTVVMILAAIGASVAFAPSWDRYLLQTALGTSTTTTAGNEFANPGPVIAGDVAVNVLLVAVLVAAALWRPIRLGAALAVGALIPMVAQAISALVQVSEPTSPLQLGFTQAQASAAGLRITNGLTPMFWVYCAFLGTLILLCVWMLVTVDSAPDRAPSYPGSYPGFGYPGFDYPGQPYQGMQQPGQPYGSSVAVPSDAGPPDPGGPGVPPHAAPQP